MILVLLLPTFVFTISGLDIDLSITSTQAQCFVSSGYSFTILRGWHCGSATSDTASITAYQNLRAAGMSHIGFYLFPCVGGSCPSATSQVQGMANFIASNGMTADSVWLDIETPDAGSACYWQGTSASKQAFYQELVSAAVAQWGSLLGVYSSYSEWQACFGSQSYVNPADTDGSLRLWYARYDNVASFADFTSFSVWQTPYAKQYTGDGTVCGVDVDINFALEWSWGGGGNVPPPPPDTAPTSPATQPVNPCTDSSGNSGYCTDSSTCGGTGGALQSSNSGAHGCEAFAAGIQCCTGGSVGASSPPVALMSCTYTTFNGKCMATTDCTSMKGQSRSSSAVATGCESFPNGIQCCIPSSSNLDDGNSVNGGMISKSAPSIGVIVGVAIGVIAVIVAVVGVCIACVLHRRHDTPGGMINYANEAYVAPATVAKVPDVIKKDGSAQFL